MIKSNKVTLKTRETYFFYRKPQKLKMLPKFFHKEVIDNFLFSVSCIVPKKRKVASYRRNNNLCVSLKMGQDESKLSFLRTSLRFYSALAILEPQIYVVVEQFGAENISLLSGRLNNLNKSAPYPRLKNSKGLPSGNLQYSKNQKMDRVARRGPLARAPVPLKGGHFRNCQHFCRS